MGFQDLVSMFKIKSTDDLMLHKTMMLFKALRKLAFRLSKSQTEKNQVDSYNQIQLRLLSFLQRFSTLTKTFKSSNKQSNQTQKFSNLDNQKDRASITEKTQKLQKIKIKKKTESKKMKKNEMNC